MPRGLPQPAEREERAEGEAVGALAGHSARTSERKVGFVWRENFDVRQRVTWLPGLWGLWWSFCGLGQGWGIWMPADSGGL